MFLNILPNVPVCRPGQHLTIGVARSEAARITCEVEANPTSLQFTWRLNASDEVTDVPQSQVTTERTRSTVTFGPNLDWDLGSLLCWARNDLGTQLEPCVYTIVPAAGRPETPVNCSIVNQTTDGLQVECEAGHDGGLPQQFFLELIDALTRALVHNVSGATPVFTVGGLPPGLELELRVVSANVKGRSRPAMLHAYTLRSAARRSVISPVMIHMTPMVGVLVGAVVTFLCVMVGIMVVIKLRRPSLQVKKSHKNATTSTHTSSDSMDSLEKDPDVIPQKAEFSDTVQTEYQKSQLSFYFNADNEMKSQVTQIFSKSVDYTELQLPPAPAAYLDKPPSQPSVLYLQPRRVTFQCQAATLPRRLGTPLRPPHNTYSTTDDSVLDIHGSTVRLRPETSSRPLTEQTPLVRTPAQVQCLTTPHF